jgi:hypothetical protein
MSQRGYDRWFELLVDRYPYLEREAGLLAWIVILPISGPVQLFKNPNSTGTYSAGALKDQLVMRRIILRSRETQTEPATLQDLAGNLDQITGLEVIYANSYVLLVSLRIHLEAKSPSHAAVRMAPVQPRATTVTRSKKKRQGKRKRLPKRRNGWRNQRVEEPILKEWLALLKRFHPRLRCLDPTRGAVRVGGLIIVHHEVNRHRSDRFDVCMLGPDRFGLEKVLCFEELWDKELPNNELLETWRYDVGFSFTLDIWGEIASDWDKPIIIVKPKRIDGNRRW